MKQERQDQLPWLPAHAAGLLPPARPRPAEEVTILLGLYNGGRFIEPQLASFVAQTHPDWRLIVSDDGSDDDGAGRVALWADRHPGREVTLLAGPRRGFAQNFLHMLRHVDSGAPYVAFSDQDDVWLPDKLARAVAALAEVPRAVPAIYCGPRIVCDAGLGHLRSCESWRRKPGFLNALVQNIAPGNTLVMNRAALRLLQAAGRRVDLVPAHDWWCYLMVMGAGGRVIRDPRPGVLYRQHPGNTLGARRGLRGALKMARFGLFGHLSAWQAMNLAALETASPYLTRENRERLAAYTAARGAPWRRRIGALRRLGVYRQTRVGTLGLWITALLGLL